MNLGIFLLGCSTNKSSEAPSAWSFQYQIEDPAWNSNLSMIKKSWQVANEQLLQIFPTPECPAPKIFLVSEEQFEQIINPALKPNGIYAKESIFLSFSISISSSQIISTLKHELTHAYLDCLSQGNSPVWFDEGLAQFMEGTYTLSEQKKDRYFLQQVKLLEQDELENSYTMLSRQNAIIAYKQSKMMFRYLLKITNNSRIKLYLKYLKENQKDAFFQAFAINLKDFYLNSKADIKRH